MSRDPHLDQKLREYLEADAEARANGITLESVYRLCERIASRQIETDQRVAMLHRRIRANERQTEVLSERASSPDWKAETTGVHAVADIKAHIAKEEDRRRDSIMWWRRQRWTWVIAALGAALLFGGNVLVALLLRR